MNARVKPSIQYGRASETAGVVFDLARSASDPAGEGPLTKLEESWIQLSELHNQLGGPQIHLGGPCSQLERVSDQLRGPQCQLRGLREGGRRTD